MQRGGFRRKALGRLSFHGDRFAKDSDLGCHLSEPVNVHQYYGLSAGDAEPVELHYDHYQLPFRMPDHGKPEYPSGHTTNGWDLCFDR